MERNIVFATIAALIISASSLAAEDRPSAGKPPIAGSGGMAAAAEPGMQKSSDRGVTVSVTPQNLGAGAKSWDFKIVLDTHSQDLSDDLMKSAVLLDGTGAQLAPVGWDGAAPGGHHREGVLRFKPVSPKPQSIELQISRAGESTPRSFRWKLD